VRDGASFFFLLVVVVFVFHYSLSNRELGCLYTVILVWIRSKLSPGSHLPHVALHHGMVSEYANYIPLGRNLKERCTVRVLLLHSKD